MAGPDISAVETGLATVLLLIAPGYLALILAQYLRGARAIKEPITSLVVGVVLSAFIASLFAVINSLAYGGLDWARIIERALAQPLRTVVQVAVLSAAVGILIPPLMRAVDLLAAKYSSSLTDGDVPPPGADAAWDRFFEFYAGSVFEVLTVDGRRFVATVQGTSLGDEPRTLMLGAGVEVTQESQTPYGEAMLLLESDVKRVVVLSTKGGSNEATTAEAAVTDGGQ